MIRSLFIGLFLIIFSTTAMSETMYVVSFQKITFRTGPGAEHKILKTIEPGVKLKLVEKGEVWSLFRLEDGSEGWILNRFATDKIPDAIILNDLKYKYDRLLKKMKGYKRLIEENKKLRTEISVKKNESYELKNNYNTLEKNSANFLEMEASFKKAKTEISELKKRNEELDADLAKRNIFWFGLGALILIVGIIIGSTKKRSRSGYL